MPDLSLFKPLCDVLGITINDLLSGEKISKDKYQERFEENIVNTIDYSTKRINKYSDKPQKNTPNQIINPQQNNQQQGVPIIIQQQPYLQPNQIIVPQLQNSVTQPIVYQQIDNQSTIIKPGQQNIIVNNEELSELDNSQRKVLDFLKDFWIIIAFIIILNNIFQSKLIYF